MNEERMRLQKFLSKAEVCSRRKAEELIADGKVYVNGKIAQLGQSVVPEKDEVKIGSKKIEISEQKLIVLMMNKPRGYVCSNLDPADGKTVFELVPEEYSSRKLFCVGRLDKDSEGLLLITNDGDLANKIIHPSNGILKRYEVVLNREFDPALTPKLLKGAKLKDEKGEDEFLKFTNVIRFPDGKKLEIHLNQGRKREIRRLFEVFGFFVKSLRRFQIGGLVLKKMALGDCRKLSKKEIEMIFLAKANDAKKAAGKAKGKLRGENVSARSKTLSRERQKFEKARERDAIIEEKIRVKRDVRRAKRAEKFAAENSEDRVPELENSAFPRNARSRNSEKKRAPEIQKNAWAKEIRPHVKNARTRNYSSRAGAKKAASQKAAGTIARKNSKAKFSSKSRFGNDKRR